MRASEILEGIIAFTALWVGIYIICFISNL